MVLYLLFLRLRIQIVFWFLMYRLGLGLLTTSKNVFNKANFERLSKKGEGSENVGKWFLYSTLTSIKHGSNFKKIRCIVCQKKNCKKLWLFSFLQCFVPLNKILIIHFTTDFKYFSLILWPSDIVFPPHVLKYCNVSRNDLGIWNISIAA